jgi:glycosyltransferase involved in cell wall biosynthesis
MDNIFVFIIPSFNNELYYKKNLNSIFNQIYKKWHLIYIDDVSTDNTYNLVNKYISECGFNNVCNVIKNKKNMKQAYNRYIAYNMCEDNEIAVMLDGDDWLIDNNVLTKLNNIYNEGDITMTYGSHKILKNKKILESSKLPVFSQENIRQKRYKYIKWNCPIHLRTFKINLLKMIPKDFLIDTNGDWLKCCTDIAETIWCLEKSDGKFKKIDEILYIYNYDNNISNKYLKYKELVNLRKYRNQVIRHIIDYDRDINLKNNNLFKDNYVLSKKHPYFGKNPFKYINYSKEIIPEVYKKKFMVSVVILNYNRPNEVLKQIKFLLGFKNINEIIISNGKKKTIIKSYNDKRVKIYDDSELNEIKGLHLRFIRANNAINKKILIIDDDIRLSYIQLKNLICIDTEVIVGYYGRSLPYSGIHEKNLNSSFYYLPIVLTKCMLINKNLVKLYLKIINNESRLMKLMKLGKPIGNGEDIVIASISYFITKKLNICLNMNYKLIEDIGSHSKDAICNRYGFRFHKNYRHNLCKFLYKDSINLSDKVISIFTKCIFNERIKFYLGEHYNDKFVYLKKYKTENIYNYCSIKYFFKKHNKFYCEPFRNKIDKYKNREFLCQFGDRRVNNSDFKSWSFMNKINDSFSFVKVRYSNEKYPVILKCLNFNRHWGPFYNNYNDKDFKEKKNKLIWRGSTTGNINDTPNRFNIVKKWYNYNNNIDIAFSKITDQYNETFIKEYYKYKKNVLSIDNLLQYKFILSIPGNDKDSGLNWKLKSNSLVFMSKPKCSTWLMEETLVPNYHYIELKDDYSDLEEKFNWCLNNENKCIQIIKNAHIFLEKFNNIYLENILENEIINIYFNKLKLIDNKNK